MQFQPTSSKQIVVLWQLMLAGHPILLSEMRPNLDVKKERKPMEEAGLIQMEKIDGKGKLHYCLNEEIAWGWAVEHMDLSEYGKKLQQSKSTGQLLVTVLERLGQYVSNNSVTLAEIVGPPIKKEPDKDNRIEMESVPMESAPVGSVPIKSWPDTSEENEESSLANVKDKITAAYKKLSGGQRRRVRLAKLKAELPRVSVDTLDTCIKNMQQDGVLVLYPMDDHSELTPEDEIAAIRVGIGSPRHIVIMG